jgi:hypothetical protein
MPYQLVLSNYTRETTKDVGGNVFLDDLPLDYQVYLLYYPGVNLNRDLAKNLKDLGKISGKNLFVNIARLDDPNFAKIVKTFGIRSFPTMIITAVDALASPPTKDSTTYIKIDNKKLLNSPDVAFECVQKMFNLFIEGKISEAIRERNRDVLNTRLKGIISDALTGVQGFLKDWDISFSFITGTLGLKYRGGK